MKIEEYLYKVNLIMFNAGDEFNEDLCDPRKDNGVPCVCIFEYSIVMSSIEFIIFLGCLVAFFIANYKK